MGFAQNAKYVDFVVKVDNKNPKGKQKLLLIGENYANYNRYKTLQMPKGKYKLLKAVLISSKIASISRKKRFRDGSKRSIFGRKIALLLKKRIVRVLTVQKNYVIIL